MGEAFDKALAEVTGFTVQLMVVLTGINARGSGVKKDGVESGIDDLLEALRKWFLQTQKVEEGGMEKLFVEVDFIIRVYEGAKKRVKEGMKTPILLGDLNAFMSC